MSCSKGNQQVISSCGTTDNITATTTFSFKSESLPAGTKQQQQQHQQHHLKGASDESIKGERDTGGGGGGGTPNHYKCDICGIVCAKPSVLKKHIRKHTNERPYPCGLCNRMFKTKSNLTKHEKSKSHSSKMENNNNNNNNNNNSSSNAVTRLSTTNFNMPTGNPYKKSAAVINASVMLKAMDGRNFDFDGNEQSSTVTESESSHMAENISADEDDEEQERLKKEPMENAAASLVITTTTMQQLDVVDPKSGYGGGISATCASSLLSSSSNMIGGDIIESTTLPIETGAIGGISSNNETNGGTGSNNRSKCSGLLMINSPEGPISVEVQINLETMRLMQQGLGRLTSQSNNSSRFGIGQNNNSPVDFGGFSISQDKDIVDKKNDMISSIMTRNDADLIAAESILHMANQRPVLVPQVSRHATFKHNKNNGDGDSNSSGNSSSSSSSSGSSSGSGCSSNSNNGCCSITDTVNVTGISVAQLTNTIAASLGNTAHNVAVASAATAAAAAPSSVMATSSNVTMTACCTTASTDATTTTTSTTTATTTTCIGLSAPVTATNTNITTTTNSLHIRPRTHLLASANIKEESKLHSTTGVNMAANGSSLYNRPYGLPLAEAGTGTSVGPFAAGILPVNNAGNSRTVTSSQLNSANCHAAAAMVAAAAVAHFPASAAAAAAAAAVHQQQHQQQHQQLPQYNKPMSPFTLRRPTTPTTTNGPPVMSHSLSHSLLQKQQQQQQQQHSLHHHHHHHQPQPQSQQQQQQQLTPTMDCHPLIQHTTVPASLGGTHKSQQQSSDKAYRKKQVKENLLKKMQKKQAPPNEYAVDSPGKHSSVGLSHKITNATNTTTTNTTTISATTTNTNTTSTSTSTTANIIPNTIPSCSSNTGFGSTANHNPVTIATTILLVVPSTISTSVISMAEVKSNPIMSSTSSVSSSISSSVLPGTKHNNNKNISNEGPCQIPTGGSTNNISTDAAATSGKINNSSSRSNNSNDNNSSSFLQSTAVLSQVINNTKILHQHQNKNFTKMPMISSSANNMGPFSPHAASAAHHSQQQHHQQPQQQHQQVQQPQQQQQQSNHATSQSYQNHQVMGAHHQYHHQQQQQQQQQQHQNQSSHVQPLHQHPYQQQQQQQFNSLPISLVVHNSKEISSKLNIIEPTEAGTNSESVMSFSSDTSEDLSPCLKIDEEATSEEKRGTPILTDQNGICCSGGRYHHTSAVAPAQKSYQKIDDEDEEIDVVNTDSEDEERKSRKDCMPNLIPEGLIVVGNGDNSNLSTGGAVVGAGVVNISNSSSSGGNVAVAAAGSAISGTSAVGSGSGSSTSRRRFGMPNSKRKLFRDSQLEKAKRLKEVEDDTPLYNPNINAKDLLQDCPLNLSANRQPTLISRELPMDSSQAEVSSVIQSIYQAITSNSSDNVCSGKNQSSSNKKGGNNIQREPAPHPLTLLTNTNPAHVPLTSTLTTSVCPVSSSSIADMANADNLSPSLRKKFYLWLQPEEKKQCSVCLQTLELSMYKVHMDLHRYTSDKDRDNNMADTSLASSNGTSSRSSIVDGAITNVNNNISGNNSAGHLNVPGSTSTTVGMYSVSTTTSSMSNISSGAVNVTGSSIGSTGSTNQMHQSSSSMTTTSLSNNNNNNSNNSSNNNNNNNNSGGSSGSGSGNVVSGGSGAAPPVILHSFNKPRNQKCAVCKVAFRVIGHLRKHYSSKSHLQGLVNVGLLSKELYQRLDRQRVHLQKIVDQATGNINPEALSRYINAEGGQGLSDWTNDAHSNSGSISTSNNNNNNNNNNNSSNSAAGTTASSSEMSPSSTSCSSSSSSFPSSIISDNL